MSRYITDGVYLYEVLRRIQNYGLRGGTFIQVVDCRTESTRMLSDLEAALCSPVAAAA